MDISDLYNDEHRDARPYPAVSSMCVDKEEDESFVLLFCPALNDL